MNALVVGDPMDEATDVGPLATASGRDDIAELVDDAVAKGAEVLTGGGAPRGTRLVLLAHGAGRAHRRHADR